MSSIEKINELRLALTDNQKNIFDILWNYYIDTGEAYPLKDLQIKLGKIRIEEALSGISGSLIREEQNNNGKRCYKLTLLGTLLTGHGKFLINYLGNFLGLIKSLYESGKLGNELKSDIVYSEIKLDEPTEKHLILRLMTLNFPSGMPFYSFNTSVDGTWTLTINDDYLIPLYHTDDIPNYLGGLLLADYNPDEPFAMIERQKFYLSRSGSALNPALGAAHSLDLIHNSKQSSGVAHSGEMPKPSKQMWPDIFESTFETYEVIDLLGEGGAGKVFAVKNEDGERFALKCLSPEYITTERRKRFKNEIDFCSKHRNKNIIQVLDTGLAIIKDTKCPFYVMPEFSMTLRKLLEQGIPSEKAFHLFVQILDGIDVAHKLKAFHRDLKPENILYDVSSDLIVVADFGIAHFEEDIIATRVATKSTAKMANLGYSAPEQRIKGAKVDHRADFFALGLILNEMFTGAVPHGFGSKTIGSVASNYSYLDSLVEWMMQNDAGARPDSIDTIKKELISRGNTFVALQQLDAKSNQVVPAFDPGKFDPIKIVGADWNNGSLKLELNRVPEIGWMQRFKSPNSGGWHSIMGSGPEYFQFNGNYAIVGASDQVAQQVVDYSKQYVEMANRSYQNDLDLKVRQEEQAYREKLRKEQAAAEARARVVSNLKV